MNTLSAVLEKRGEKQDGINMVDLMMWLVIAALLLAAAIQGIGYYQKAAYLYQMQSDLDGAGTVATGVAANEDGVVTKLVAEKGVSEAKHSTGVVTTVELASDGKTPYLRGTHPGVDDKDVLYLFDACNDTYKIGVNVVPKGGTAELEDCGISTPPAGGGTGGTPTANDLDGDGIDNASDPDIDGDGIDNAADPDIDGDGEPNGSDTTPNGETAPGGGDGGGTPPVTGTGFSMAAFGDNTDSRAGIDSPAEILSATNIGSMTFSKVSAGNQHSCGISDGKAYCWGWNHMGRLGIGAEIGAGDNGYGDHVTMTSPTAVDTRGALNGKTITDISAGWTHSCAVADGAVFCWGGDTYRQTLGTTDDIDGYQGMQFAPVQVSSGAIAGKTIKSVDAAGARTCALDTAGLAYCWGDTQALGDGIDRGSRITSEPVAVAGGHVFTSLIGLYQQECGISAGDAYCWGVNSEGKLGIDNTDQSARAESPTKVVGLPAGKVTSISAGDEHTCAIADGKAYCWGANWSGQLGDGSGSNRSFSAVAVDATGVLSGLSLTKIEAGNYVTCASDGSGLFCWGDGPVASGSEYDWNPFTTPVKATGVIEGKSIKDFSLGNGQALVLYQ